MIQKNGTWLVLLVSLPPASSRVRVGVWRKLKRMGAVSLKGAAWLLPKTGETTELFQWLMQEVGTLGGEAALLHVDRIEPLDGGQLGELFRKERGAEYEAVRRTCEALLGSLAGKATLTAETIGRVKTKLGAAKRELARVDRIDYLRAPEGEAARAIYERVEMKLGTVGARPKKAKPVQREGMPPLHSVWVTRERPHIDRIASAWLVKRFYDPSARFAFAKDPKEAKKGVPFDVLGAEFGHQGEDCTFETILKRLGLKDPKLKAIAEMVHEADLRDGKYSRAESAGLELTLLGLASTHPEDRKLLDAGMALFDGLYAALKDKK